MIFFRLCKSIVIRINDNLGQYSGNRFINAAGKQFCADCILQVISDVALTHGRADGHRREGVIRMCFSEFVHCSCVSCLPGGRLSVGDHNICAILYQVCDGFCRCSGSGFLLRQSGSQRFVSQCNYYSFFRS